MTLGALALAPQPAALTVTTTEDDPLTVVASFAAGTGLTIQWGDDKQEKIGSDVTALKHTYEKAGSYTVHLQTETATSTNLIGTVTVEAGTPPAVVATDAIDPLTNTNPFTDIGSSQNPDTQRFRTGDDEGFPFCPAPFEATTNVEFGSRVGSVAQFNIATFIGKTLYMTKRLGESEDPEKNTSIRPKRIQSFDDGNYYLSSLIIPRFENQIDALYGWQDASGKLSGTVIKDPATGKAIVNPEDEVYQGIIPNSRSAKYVQVSW